MQCHKTALRGGFVLAYLHMSKNPFLNAIAASLYIGLVALVLDVVSHFAGQKPDTILAPIAFISLFTLSAGVMAYLFLSEPVQMFLAGEKKKAVALFVQTLGVFAGITVALFAVVFLTSIR